MKKKCVLFLIFVLIGTAYLQSRKLTVLHEVGNPDYILIDSGQLLVIDNGKQLHQYSMKDFKYQKQLFHRGEGPSENLCLGFVQLSPEYIYLYCMKKSLFFTRDGKFIKEIKTHLRGVNYILPVKDKFLIETSTRQRSSAGSSYSISLYFLNVENEMKYEKVLYYYEIPSITWKGNKRPLTLIKSEQNVCIFENRIFICDSDRGLFAQVYDSNGDKLSQVRLELEKIKVPENYSAEFFGNIKESGKIDSFNSEFYYDQPEYFPAFFRFYVGKNKCYFLTYKRIGNNREVVVCDWKGNNIRKAYIPWVNYWDLRNYTIWEDKFYWLVDNQDTEEWELHVADVK